MKHIKFALCFVTVACAALSVMAATAAAKYPEKPIVLICWVEPGSAPDILLRGVAQIGEKYVGQPMTVLTKTGGGGTVGMAHLLRQKPDGYTILGVTLSYCSLLAWGKGAPMKNEDFAPVCQLHVESPILAINAQRPYDTWQKFVEYAKKNPNTIKVALGGAGTIHHINWLRIKKMVGIQTLEIPYDGGRPAITSAMGGHDDAVINNPSVMKIPIETGKLKGIFTVGGKRIEALPDIPTLKELGINFERYQWRGIMAQAGVPRDIINYLAQAFKKMTEDPEWLPFLKKFVWEPAYLGPEEFTKLVGEEIAETREIMIEAGLLKQ